MRTIPSAFVSLIAVMGMFVPALAQGQASKATSSQRSQLASEMKTIAFEFAANPEDFALVTKVEELSWKMILMSEGISSCVLPAYDLPQQMTALNSTYAMMVNSMNSMGNMPESVKKQSMAAFEGPINGQKRKVGMVLENVIKYCK